MFSRSHGACRPAPPAKPSGSPPLLARRLRRGSPFGLAKRTWLLILGALLAGCDIDLDPDSLVREIRVLGGRIGDPDEGSVSQLELGRESLSLRTLVASPSGPGRRQQMAPSPVLDWYMCLSPRSLILPGSIDPACAKFGPTDPDPKSGMNPSLLYLATGAEVQVATAPIVAQLQRQLLDALLGMGGMGMGGFMLPDGPLLLQLPIVIRAANFPGATDMLDTETAFLFGRMVYAPPGIQQPPPNHNPVLGDVTISENEMDDGAQVLTPCPAAGACQAFPVRRDGAYFLTPKISPESVERYVPLDESGRGEIEEVLRVAWFSTDGQFSQQRTGVSLPQTKWENVEPYWARPEVKTVDIWVVLQDNRGGSTWKKFALTFIE